LASVGRVSYGLYLWHWVILQSLLTHRAVPVAGQTHADYAAHIVVLLGASLAAAWCSWRFIEQPVMSRIARPRPRLRLVPAPGPESAAPPRRRLRPSPTR